jgi:hypothetical protein
MPSSRQLRFEAKMARDGRDAARTAAFRDAFNDAPRCPWIYGGFEEPPRLRKTSGSRVDAGELDLRLRSIVDAAARALREADRDD